jgi:DNA primase
LIETFQLGYAPQSWDSLIKFLNKKNFSEKDIETAGLALQSPKNKLRYYDRFRGRLMFPIIDSRQNVLGFSGRLLDNTDKQAKYVNTPETPIYHKRETLYGIHASHEHIRTSKAAIIVEGEFDMISCFKHGLSHCVAIKGSAFTKDQLMLLKRYTKHLILALDTDFSGTQTTLRAIKDAEEMDFRIDVVHSNIGKDPDEALEKNAAVYKKLFKKPTPIYDFILETALARHNPDDAFEKKELANDVIPFIKEISNPIIRSHYIKRLADLIHSDVRDIEAAMRTSVTREKFKQNPVPTRQATKPDRHEVLQKYVLSLMFQNENTLKFRDRAKDIVQPSHFSIPSYSEIYSALLAYKGNTLDIEIFSQGLSVALQSVLDELFLQDISINEEHAGHEKTFKKTLYELKKLSIKNTLREYVKDPTKSEMVHSLMGELSQVEKELRIL